MPFVTEELWQRLPNIEQMMPQETIMLAPYPKAIEDWVNPTVNEDMELIKEVIHSARSLRSQYKIANHIKANFFFKTENEEMKTSILEQADDFCTLAKANFLQYFDSSQEIPKGYCIQVISDQVSLLVDLTGLIDIDTEIARLTKDIERLTPMISTYERKIIAKDYDTKVPEDVRKANAEKLSSYQTELDETNRAMEIFSSMKKI
jgi:valyl-tRNA synthetase